MPESGCWNKVPQFPASCIPTEARKWEHPTEVGRAAEDTGWWRRGETDLQKHLSRGDMWTETQMSYRGQLWGQRTTERAVVGAKPQVGANLRVSRSERHEMRAVEPGYGRGWSATRPDGVLKSTYARILGFLHAYTNIFLKTGGHACSSYLLRTH